MADAFFSSVSLLLLGDGADASTSIVDSSNNTLGITLTGNTQISTTAPKYGTGSILMDGTGDWLVAAANAVLVMTGPLTIDWWIKTTKTTGIYCPIGSNESDDGTGWLFLHNVDVAGDMKFFASGTTRLSSAAADLGVNDGNWHHEALVRDGSNVLTYYFDGVYKSAGSYGSGPTYATQMGTSGVGVLVGTQQNATSRTVNGRMDCVRITKGVARWTGTGSFTPPSSLNDYLAVDVNLGGPFPFYIRSALRGGLYLPRGF